MLRAFRVFGDSTVSSNIRVSFLCRQHDQLLVALFSTAQCLSFPSFPKRSLKSNGRFASALPMSSLTIPPCSQIQNIHLHTNLQCNTYTHIHRNTTSPLGGCPKVSGPEGRTQKHRKQLGVREVLGPISVTFPDTGPLLIELLLRRLFYRRQEQLSIWFPLFLC